MKITIDPWIILSILLLFVFSFFNILGVKPVLSDDFIRYSLFSLFLFIFGNYIGTKIFRDNINLVYIIFIGLFLITLFFGGEVRGAKRWLFFGTLSFQTGEFFKPFFLILISSLLAKYKHLDLRKAIICIAITFPSIFFILIQPDLTNAILYFMIVASLLFFAGLSIRYYIFSFILGIATIPIGWHLLKDYQKSRIVAFMNPKIDLLGLNYNINQSIIAIGSGGLFGKGLGMGTQSKLNFLPEFHTDFAYASLIEQFGLIGGIVILSLFFIIIYRLIIILKKERKSRFNKYYLLGTIFFIAVSVFLNIGMNLGVLPVAGIALPFISYGGSITSSTMLMLGFAMSLR